MNARSLPRHSVREMTPSRLISIPSNRIRWVCASATVENVIAATANPAASDACVMNLVIMKTSGFWFAHTVPSFAWHLALCVLFIHNLDGMAAPSVTLHPSVTAITRERTRMGDTHVFSCPEADQRDRP